MAPQDGRPREKQDSNSNRKSLEFYVLKSCIPSKALSLSTWYWLKKYFLQTSRDDIERLLLLVVLLVGCLIDVITITHSPEALPFPIGHSVSTQPCALLYEVHVFYSWR